jgi:hypothetical protein
MGSHTRATSIVKDPRFAAPAFPDDDYRLPNGSPGVGFVPFDYWKAGTSALHSVQVPAYVIPTFPTAVFDPATDF